MKKLAIALALVLAFAPLGMAYFSPDDSDSVSNSITTSSDIAAAGITLAVTSVSVLSAASQTETAGTIRVVSNGTMATDCTTGGASVASAFTVVCLKTASTALPWVSLR